MNLKPDRVVQTARRARASVREGFNDKPGVLADLFAKVGRCGFGEGGFGVPGKGDLR